MLQEDLFELGLGAGDVGAVVEAYGTEGLEVKFVTGPDMTQALLTLKISQVRSIGDDETLSVRSVAAA